MICLLMTQLTTYAFEEQTYQEDFTTANFARQLVSDLGTEVPELMGDTVTRADFTKLVVRLISKGNVEKTNSQFSDVDADSELSYDLFYAQSRGIISAGEYFYPDHALTMTEAVKIAACTLGYRMRAELRGGYPAGYLRVAREIDMTDNLPDITDREISPQEAYILLYNMLRTNLYDIRGISEDSVNYVIGSETILSVVYNIQCIEGIEKANIYTSLTNKKDGLGENRIRIGTHTTYYYGENDYLGYNVRAYIRDIEGENLCLYLEPYQNSTVTFNGREYDGIKEGRVSVFDSDKEKKFNVSDGLRFIYNNNMISAETASKLPPDSEYTVCMVDHDMDNVYDCVFIKEYRYCFIKSISYNKMILTDENSVENEIDLRDTKYECKVSGTYEDKSISSIEDLEAGMLVACVLSEDKTCAEIYVCDNAKEVQVTKLYKKENKLEAGGEKYDYGRYFKRYYENKISFNAGTRIYFGINGEAVAADFPTAGSKFGWLVATNSKNRNSFEDLKVKIYTEDGKMEIFDVDSKAKIDGETPGSLFADVIDGLGVNNRLVKFMLNGNGKISNIDTAEAYSEETPFPDYRDKRNALTLFYDNSESGLEYKTDQKGFMDKFCVNNAVIFSVPKDTSNRGDENEYSMLSTASLSNDTKYYPMAYNLNHSLEAEAVVIFESNDDITRVSTDGILVQDVYRTIDENGDSCYGVSVCDNGNYKYLYSNENTEKEIAALKKGDIVRLGIRGNTICGIIREYSYEEDQFFKTYGEVAAVNWMKGLAYDTSENSLSILKNQRSIPAKVGCQDLKVAALTSNTTYIYIRTGDDGSVSEAVVRPILSQSIQSVKMNGENAAFVVVQRRFYTTRRMFVYVTE